MQALSDKEIKELTDKAQQKKKDEETGVREVKIGDVTVYEGANGGKYKLRGDALNSLQREKEVKEFESRGLNSNGQTPKQEAAAKKRAEKLKIKDGLLKQLAGVDEDIADFERELREPEPKKDVDKDSGAKKENKK